MPNVLNVFICLAAPMLLTLFLLKGNARRFNVFLITGMAICFLASNANQFLFGLLDYSSTETSIYVAPITEEILKALPILFYVIRFRPDKNDIIMSALAVGIGFATLENCFYITVFGSSELLFVLVRGFASGIMHAVCTATIGFGMCYAYSEKKLDLIMTFGLLSTAITYHSIYNMLVSDRGFVRDIGCMLPIITAAVAIIYRNRRTIINALLKLKNMKPETIETSN